MDFVGRTNKYTVCTDSSFTVKRQVGDPTDAIMGLYDYMHHNMLA